jgi:hypothetical protein
MGPLGPCKPGCARRPPGRLHQAPCRWQASLPAAGECHQASTRHPPVRHIGEAHLILGALAQLRDVGAAERVVGACGDQLIAGQDDAGGRHGGPRVVEVEAAGAMRCRPGASLPGMAAPAAAAGGCRLPGTSLKAGQRVMHGVLLPTHSKPLIAASSGSSLLPRMCWVRMADPVMCLRGRAAQADGCPQACAGGWLSAGVCRGDAEGCWSTCAAGTLQECLWHT